MGYAMHGTCRMKDWKKTGNTEIWNRGNGWVKGEAGKTEIQ